MLFRSKPMPVEQQVLVLYALTHGFIDDVAIEDIQRYQDELIEYVQASHKAIFDEILETHNLPAEDKMDAAIADFKKTFQASDAQ